jgi:hypothetical protein
MKVTIGKCEILVPKAESWQPRPKAANVNWTGEIRGKACLLLNDLRPNADLVQSELTRLLPQEFGMKVIPRTLGLKEHLLSEGMKQVRDYFQQLCVGAEIAVTFVAS